MKNKFSEPIHSILGLTILLFAGQVGAVEKTSVRPNIIFILVDDLRWDALGCAGNPVAKTPNIDRIAGEGAQFRNFFVSIPLCSPSRSSFLTGQYAHRTGIIDNTDHSELSHKLVTFPRLLHDDGYESAYVGKWHMGNDNSPREGFDYWACLPGQGAYQNPPMNINGKNIKSEGYVTDIFNEHALKFIRGEHTKPFVLYLAHKAVHGPFAPPERHKNLYADAKFSIPPSVNDSFQGKPVLTREMEKKADNSKPAKKKQSTPHENAGSKRTAAGNFPQKTAVAQLRCLAAVDEGVGEIFKALEETKQLDNTIIIFSSDNGYLWGEHGLGDKRWAYEESIRDPLLVRFPKLIKAGTRIDQLALNIDIAPTVLALAGTPIPKTIQGKSLLPLLKNSQAAWRNSILTEYFQEKQYPRTPTWQSARTDRWKFIHYAGLDGMDELYDLKSDPFEMKNLIHDPMARKELGKMQTELKKLQKEF